MPTTPRATSHHAKEVTADRRTDSEHRAYHLNRITSKFRTSISAGNARRLARLLAHGSDTAPEG